MHDKVSRINNLTWEYIDKHLDELKPVKGGYSSSRRGILLLPDGDEVFVKYGVDPSSTKWLRKEIDLYSFLSTHNYQYVPKLIAKNKDNTGLALEAITPENNWVWDNIWDDNRVQTTFNAVNELAKIKVEKSEKILFEHSTVSNDDDGWKILASNKKSQEVLRESLERLNRADIFKSLNFKEMANISSKFVFNNDTLVHYDIRADNCAWNPVQQKVCLIDWDWAQMGDTRIDSSSLLINIRRSSFDITKFTDKLDKDAVQWLAGFWLAASTKDSLVSDKGELRRSQLESAIIALDIFKTL